VSNEQQYPDALDALIAAPEHHKLLFENETARVLDACIAPVSFELRSMSRLV